MKNWLEARILDLLLSYFIIFIPKGILNHTGDDSFKDRTAHL
jgi:hypothetical protein